MCEFLNKLVYLSSFDSRFSRFCLRYSLTTRFPNAIMELESKAEIEPATPVPDGKLASGDASLAAMLESKDGEKDGEKPVDASLAAAKLDQILEKLVAGVMSANVQSQLEATTHFRKVRPNRSRAAA